MNNLLDEKTKEKLFYLLAGVVIALIWIIHIPSYIDAWQ